MAEGSLRLAFSFRRYCGTELFYEFLGVRVDLFRGSLQSFLSGGLAFHSQGYDRFGEEWVWKVVACPVHCLVFKERVLHQMAEGVSFSFHLNLEESLGFLQYVNLQLGTLPPAPKSSASRLLSTFRHSVQRRIRPDSTSSPPHLEQYALITPMSRPTVVSFGIRWLTSITFPRIMSLGLQTSPMKRSNLGLELEMCSMPVNGGCSLCPSTTMMLMMAIFSWTFSTTPKIVDPSSGTIGGPAEVFTETMWRLESTAATPVWDE